MMSQRLILIQIMMTVLLLAGCSAQKKYEVQFNQKYKVAVLQAKKKIKPLPNFTDQAKVIFHSKLDPFNMSFSIEKPIVINARSKTPLEKYSINSFLFAGIFVDGGDIRAIFIGPDGYFYRAKVGDYIGLKEGRISKINRDGIVEISVPTKTFSGKTVTKKVILKFNQDE